MFSCINNLKNLVLFSKKKKRTVYKLEICLLNVHSKASIMNTMQETTISSDCRGFLQLQMDDCCTSNFIELVKFKSLETFLADIFTFQK